MTLRSLREQMAIVTQENILFHDTVWNNICYGLANLGRGARGTAPRKRRWRTISFRNCRKATTRCSASAARD